jgi:L-alanine-DL-glutamate epimerase-like enolase superfamily enzyme
VRVERIQVSAFRVPTPARETDGTFEWDATTLVLVQACAEGQTGIGYTYADRATAVFIEEHLRAAVVGVEIPSPQAAWARMRHVVRNVGRPGVASMAIAAVDTALWDLEARRRELPLVELLGRRRGAVLLYGSGGFISYSNDELAAELERWRRDGIRLAKIKVGRDDAADVERLRFARSVVGDDVQLMVDANGAYTPRRAVAQGARYAELGATWFEEPVSSDDVRGMVAVRRALRGAMDVAAGEYGYDLPHFDRLIGAGAVDVLQADVTRCAGITELLRVDALCAAANLPLSLHTAPALHLHVACALDQLRHLEYFADHVRIEDMFFDGVPRPVNGQLTPDTSRAGNGLTFCSRKAEPFRL